MAYSIPLTYCLERVINYTVSADISFELDYGGLICLTGLLHIAEGILTNFYGYKENELIVTYKKDKIAGGYKLYRKWRIPLLLFVYKGIYIPTLAMMIYADESFTMFPKQKAQKMGRWIGIYGAALCYSILLYRRHYLNIFEVMLFAALGHESIFAINRLYEKGRLI